MGKLHYLEDDAYGCQEYDTEKVVLNRTDDLTPFMIAERGECSFVQKVRNMENIGVSVAIIVDSRAEMIDEILMSDDGTGGGIRIPSMLIGMRDGDTLLNWYKKATQEEKDQLVLMSEFVMPEFTTVGLDFWFTSSSDRAISFLEDFKKIETNLGSLLDFRPRYVFWECTSCDKTYLENDCFGGGKYCAVESTNAKLKGRDIVLEDLRQLCIWENLSSTNQTQDWWSYMSHVHKTCYNVISDECSQRAHEEVGIDWEVTQQCINDSFGSSDRSKWGLATAKNSFIDEEIAYWKEYGTNIYPSIVINKKTYRGQIEPLSVFNAVCAGFTDPPDQCLKTLHKEKTLVSQTMVDGDSISVGLIVGIVVALILVNVVIVYCCRRKAKRDMNNEMQMQIESAVSQYFALTQKDGPGSQA